MLRFGACVVAASVCFLACSPSGPLRVEDGGEAEILDGGAESDDGGHETREDGGAASEPDGAPLLDGGRADGGRADGGRADGGGRDAGPSADGGVADAGSSFEDGGASASCICEAPSGPVAGAPIRPGQSVRLRARCTVPAWPPGVPMALAYRWTFVSRPFPTDAGEQITAGSDGTASFMPRWAAPRNAPYVVRLTAENAFGPSPSCDVEVPSTPQGIHAQLTWNRAETEVDLHLLRGAGVDAPFSSQGFFSTTNDVWPDNDRVSWGDPYPVTNQEAHSGLPEVIAHPTPRDGERYLLGLHYRCDGRVGLSNAKIRLFCNGELTEVGPVVLNRSGDLWIGVRVEYPSCVVTRDHQTRSSDRGC